MANQWIKSHEKCPKQDCRADNWWECEDNGGYTITQFCRTCGLHRVVKSKPRNEVRDRLYARLAEIREAREASLAKSD